MLLRSTTSLQSKKYLKQTLYQPGQCGTVSKNIIFKERPKFRAQLLKRSGSFQSRVPVVGLIFSGNTAYSCVPEELEVRRDFSPR